MARLLAPLAVLLLAGPALAQEMPPAGTDWKALLIETIEANGCSMSEEQASNMLPPLGFSEDWTAVIVEEMVTEGSARLDETTWSLTVKTEKCP
ncbi:hypothetical protein [Pseudogemmobacter bohemicus]|uniref:hypothetical protein n=1 Tax=Pseudogemmobacter bohemicus TaxID=2250708 RepID=UPI000DD303A3|nr:hypothetical protein [Pseudogemmobacter bohemicus]